MTQKFKLNNEYYNKKITFDSCQKVPGLWVL